MSQLDLCNTADCLTAYPADLIRMAGVANFQKVSDDLYRSALPTAQGLRNLKSLGVRTVVNLCSFHSNVQEIRKTGLNYEQIRVKGWYPKEKQVIKFLRLVTNNRKTPVLVHCEHGVHRTGVMCLIYRIALQGWTKEEALKEMTKEEFWLHGTWYHLIHLIQSVNNLDIVRIKQKARIGEIKKPFWSANDGDRFFLLAMQRLIALKPTETFVRHAVNNLNKRR